MRLFKSSFFLVILFAFLFGYYWFYQKDIGPIEPSPSTSPIPQVALTTSDTKQIDTISWKSASYSGTIKQTQDDSWILVEPAGIQVDQQKMKEIAASVTNMTGQQRIKVSDVPSHDTGLASPYLELTVINKDKSESKIKFGRKTFDSSYYYAQKGAEDLTLVFAYLVDQLNKNPQELRPDPSVAPAAGSASPAFTSSPQF